jgi:hypothetical protein
MLTLFSTPKPFKGHIATIQLNALRSWTLLHPDVEVIVFGDEEGTAAVCCALGLRHVEYVERSESGTKYVNYLFGKAQEIAKHDLLCYLNCDIVLMDDFLRAIERLMCWRKNFLMIGRRWDTNVGSLLEFLQQGWQDRLLDLARSRGVQRSASEIDYFVFQRGLYRNIPPLVNGRIYWDNWLVWKAGKLKVPVVDATPVVVAVHQNHDYGYHPGGLAGVWDDTESERNRQLAGGFRHLHCINDASYVLESHAIRRNYRRWLVPLQREFFQFRGTLIRRTRPLRQRFGLTHRALVRLGLLPPNPNEGRHSSLGQPRRRKSMVRNSNES